MWEIRSYLNRGTLVRLYHRRNVRFLIRWWNVGDPGKQTYKKSTNSRMIQELVFHTQQTIKTTSTQDLDPLPLANNDHTSVLPFEMYTIEPGEPPTRTLNWNPLWFRSHIKHRTNDDRFPLSLWEVWFDFTLGMPIPALIGPSQWCIFKRGVETHIYIYIHIYSMHLGFGGSQSQDPQDYTGDGQGKGWPRDKRLRGFTKTSRTGWSSPSSSYLNIGLHFDSCAIWQFTCAYYRSDDNCILIVQTP